MQFNNFSIYSYNAGAAQLQKLDELDVVMQDLMRMTEYDDVKDFLLHKFGDIEGNKWIDYPELNKTVYIYIDDEKVECCALKNNEQYWGKGWILEDSE